MHDIHSMHKITTLGTFNVGLFCKESRVKQREHRVTSPNVPYVPI